MREEEKGLDQKVLAQLYVLDKIEPRCSVRDRLFVIGDWTLQVGSPSFFTRREQLAFIQIGIQGLCEKNDWDWQLRYHKRRSGSHTYTASLDSDGDAFEVFHTDENAGMAMLIAYIKLRSRYPYNWSMV